MGCPIRKSTDQSLLAAPHGLSQRAASFIASQCQGIHQMPFRRLILNSAVAPRAGTSPDARTTPQDALTIEPTPEGAGPRSVLGHLTIVFTLSMIPLQSPPLRGARSSRFRVAFPSDGSLPEHPVPTPGPRHQNTGGGRRDRTDDLLLAKQALSQLSYAPNVGVMRCRLMGGGPGRI